MLARIQAYLAEGTRIQPDWIKYIDDLTIDIDLRWEAFLAAPAEWRTFMTGHSVPLECLSELFSSPYDELNMEEGNVKDVDDLIGCVLEEIEDGKAEESLLNEAKEEAIKERLGEWRYGD